jgi:GntR family transcriptional regulator
LLTAHLRHEITFAGRKLVPRHIAQAAGVADDVEMVTRRRVLFDMTTGGPQEIGASYIPLDIGGGTYLEEPVVVPKALFLCVEELSGRQYAAAHDRWLWRQPDSSEMATLRISAGVGVVHVVHTARAQDGTLLEVSESIWPADRIELIDEYDVASRAEDVKGLSDI